MAQEKLFTAKEAALAVLKKTQELLEASSLVKAEKMAKDAPPQGQTLGAAIGFPGAPATAPVTKAELAKSGWRGDEKGVHGTDNHQVAGGTKEYNQPGKSRAGAQAIAGKTNPSGAALGEAKAAHKKVLGEIKSIKPKLDKSEGPANNVESQPAPNKNPAEVAENSNPAPGALPQNTEKFAAEIKGHLKLAKFIGRMESKRAPKKVESNG